MLRLRGPSIFELSTQGLLNIYAFDWEKPMVVSKTQHGDVKNVLHDPTFEVEYSELYR